MWVKICGIRDVPTALEVAKLRPDAIGLNFFAKSPRNVPVDIAAEIVRALPESVEPIGLFVNHSIAEVESTLKQTGLKTVQLHGDETPEFLAELTKLRPDVQILRAYRMGEAGLAPLDEYLAVCRALGVTIRAVLVDALVAGQFGGTGQTVPWESLRSGYRRAEWPPLILAGGLTPDNIGEAIRTAEPWGVDVAGGVESAPGVKNIARVERFIAEARR
jgi:phosphoribosylanthranilate isomerase